MVSVVLLTTEEILEKNRFWYCLDSVWVTEELEPFEEVKYEHMFTKPLSRDYYYALYPDIPRSESDDENSLSLIGFKNKHQEWKSKICLKMFDARRRNLSHSYLNNSRGRKETIRVDSLQETHSNVNRKNNSRSNDERVLDFLKRLQESVPPPPIEDLQLSCDVSSGSIEYPKEFNNLNDMELPEYDDFANIKTKQNEYEDQNVLPTTSTLKRPGRNVYFNDDKSQNNFEYDETWYDSIYGVSDIISSTLFSDKPQINETVNNTDDNLDAVDCFLSWSEILMECDVKEDSIIRSKESITTSDDIVSCSNANAEIAGFDSSENEETGYARFAIYKIHQTLKIAGDNMLDSSSMIDLSYTENNLIKKSARSPSFFGSMYRLAPNSIEDSE